MSRIWNVLSTRIITRRPFSVFVLEMKIFFRIPSVHLAYLYQQPHRFKSTRLSALQ